MLKVQTLGAALLTVSVAAATAASCVSPNATATASPTVSDTPRAVEITGTREPRSQPVDHPVILLVLDGVRYQEIFAGADRALAQSRGMDVSKTASPEKLMPNLHRAIQTRGLAFGAPGHGGEVIATGPNYVSLPGYLELFTGRDPGSCQSNECAMPKKPTLLDEIRDVSNGNGDVAVFASWQPIERVASNDPTSMVMSTGRESSRNRGEITNDRKAALAFWAGTEAKSFPSEAEDYRPDEHTARVALRYLTTKQPRFMFLGLGDADEYGHKNDYWGYLSSLKAYDKVIRDLFETLDTMGERGKRTVVLITADHGREKGFRDHGGDYPESGRVWLVAAGGDVPIRGVASLSRERRLADVAPTIRQLMALPADTSPGAGTPIEEIVGSAPAPIAARP